MNYASRFSVALLAAIFIGNAQAGEITILTPFPKEITDVYKTAFEKKYPNVKVEAKSMGTSKAIASLRETPAGQRPDIFWASAPDAFEVLARDKMLEKLGDDVGNRKIPAKIASFPVNDPEGFYKGQALSGYGIMSNRRYLRARQLPSPYQWSDLTKPVYFGHVVMSSPSRSGTTHLTVETILQGEGWNKGWAQVLEIAGNCSEITERSTDVPEGVSTGKYGLGLVIDFLGLSKKYSGAPVDFAYPAMTAVVPANIALVVGSKNAADAKTFINFTLSAEGQELLFDSKVSRLPALPDAYFSGKMPSGYPNVFHIAQRAKVRFKTDVSESRYAVVSALFDQAITSRMSELQAVTKAIHAGEAKLASKPIRQAQELLKQARALAYGPVVDEALVNSKEFVAQFKKSKKEADKKLTVAEEEWGKLAIENYSKATQLANRALALMQ